MKKNEEKYTDIENGGYQPQQCLIQKYFLEKCHVTIILCIETMTKDFKISLPSVSANKK